MRLSLGIPPTTNQQPVSPQFGKYKKNKKKKEDKGTSRHSNHRAIRPDQ